MIPDKVCPILFRDPSLSRILVFKHPLAGIQLVKGGIEPGEAPAAAALRELREESGICDASVERYLGLWVSGFEEQLWWLQTSAPLLEGQPSSESWVHHTQDDGGLDFSFYWHPVEQAASDDSDPLFAAHSTTLSPSCGSMPKGVRSNCA